MGSSPVTSFLVDDLRLDIPAVRLEFLNPVGRSQDIVVSCCLHARYASVLLQVVEEQLFLGGKAQGTFSFHVSFITIREINNAYITLSIIYLPS